MVVPLVYADNIDDDDALDVVTHFRDRLASYCSAEKASIVVIISTTHIIRGTINRYMLDIAKVSLERFRGSN